MRILGCALNLCMGIVQNRRGPRKSWVGQAWPSPGRSADIPVRLPWGAGRLGGQECPRSVFVEAAVVGKVRVEIPSRYCGKGGSKAGKDARAPVAAAPSRCAAFVILVFLLAWQALVAATPRQARTARPTSSSSSRTTTVIRMSVVLARRISRRPTSTAWLPGRAFHQFLCRAAGLLCLARGADDRLLSNRVGILGALGPKSKTGLNSEETTVAEILQDARLCHGDLWQVAPGRCS